MIYFALRVDVYLVPHQDRSRTLTTYVILVCPANCVGSHGSPQVDDIVSLEIWERELVDERGVAVVCRGWFLGWVLRKDGTAVWSTLEDGGLIEGRVTAVDSFYWTNGGGLCTLGRICVDVVGN